MTPRRQMMIRPGTRVRLKKSTWPERTGCLATVVDYPQPGVYPDPVGVGEVLLLLDEDPLTTDSNERGWTCVERGALLEILS